jgi:DNA primase small subunit
VKEDAIRLVEEFLTSDFGIAKKDISLNFSGNRGYHIHVHDKGYQEIGSDERKEIVDYILGIGLDYHAFFELDGARPNDRIERGPRPDESGYRGRFVRAVIAEIEKNPKSISRVFTKEDTRRRLIDGIKAGNWNNQPFKVNDFIGRLAPIAATLGLMSVNTDAGVTQDLSKLIRVPNSVHGETGLIARKVRDVDKFDPFKDAMIPSGDALRVRFIEDVPDLPLSGEPTGPFKKDDEKELNRSVGLFYVLKGSAEIIS